MVWKISRRSSSDGVLRCRHRYSDERGFPYLFLCHRPLRGLVELLDCLGVATEIFLAADKDDGESRAEMNDFGDPLLQ